MCVGKTFSRKSAEYKWKQQKHVKRKENQFKIMGMFLFFYVREKLTCGKIMNGRKKQYKTCKT